MWKVDIAYLLGHPIIMKEWCMKLEDFARDHEKETMFVPTYVSLEQKQSFLKQSCQFLIHESLPSDLATAIMNVLRLFCRECVALEILSAHYQVRGF
jgi:hypothetical protein